MDGKVVQLVQGPRKGSGGRFAGARCCERFAAFPEIQVIDLDAAMGRGSNDALVPHARRTRRHAAPAAACARRNAPARSSSRARASRDRGHRRALLADGRQRPACCGEIACRCRSAARSLLIALDSQGAAGIVVKGWREATAFTAEEVLGRLEPYCAGLLCTYVDKEGMLQGTDLEWFRRLRAGTSLELTAAGGITTLDEVKALLAMDVHAALGMAIYTGRLDLAELAKL